MRRLQLLPPGATANAGVLLSTRAVRAVGDGVVSVVLAVYLTALGLSATEVGIVVTATLLGSAALSLSLALLAHRQPRRRLLQLLSVLMIVTGLGFAWFQTLWPLVVVGLVGTLNPGGTDVSAFQPLEHAALPETVAAEQRTAIFARYSLVGTLVAAVGAGLAGLPGWAADHLDITLVAALRWAFVGYAALGAVLLVRYRAFHDPPPPEPGTVPPRRGLGRSRATVLRLAALFSLDSFGGGFTITAILVLWLQLRFDVSLATGGAVFLWAGLLAAWSQLLAPRLAARIGLVRTMAFTHLPANAFLVLAAVMPTAPLAIGCLLVRAALSQMDVPARTSYVMAVVDPDERAAAASITGVPRSLAAALPPVAAGWLLTISSFGWPLVIGGLTKITYDLLLLHGFRHQRPPEELDAPQLRPSDGAAPEAAGPPR